MEKTEKSFTLYKRLIRTYVLRYRRILGLAAVCMLLVAGTTAANAYLMQPVLDDIFVNKDERLLMLLPLGIAILAILNAAGDYGQALSLKYIGQRVVSDMQMDLFAHLIRSDLTLFHDQSTGRLISRLTNDIALMRQSVSNVFTGLIKESVTMVFLVGVMIYQNWQMSVMSVFILVFAILPIARLGRRMRKIANATQSQLADFTAQLDGTFQGVRVVKSYGREEYEIERSRLTIRKLVKLYYRASRVQALASPLVSLVGMVAIAAVLWYGGFHVIRGETTPGQFFSFITAMIMAYRPVKSIASLTNQMNEGMAAAGRFFSVVDVPPTIRDKPGAAPLDLRDGHIAFEQVDFYYANGHAGLRDLSLDVAPGSTVALVGSSGAGKSTLMNLLLRFYEVSDGRILIDGQDIREVTLDSLRHAFALVSQEVVLFDDTIRANIAYGRLDATEEEIIEAAKKAHAHAFILALPQGYDTIVGPNGVRLSGGQRQRVSIARAILKDAPILLLDEATSALDTASERAVQDALEGLMQGRTTLVIAHRLSTIQHADRIVVLDQGRIIDQGTHASLLEHSAAYKKLHQLVVTTEEKIQHEKTS